MIRTDGNPLSEPLFLNGQAGRLFALYVQPSKTDDTGSDLLYVPPFAEEMNRTRRTAVVQAQNLARRGVGVLLLDLYGTGDSEGGFVDARWPIWLDDVCVAANFIEGRGRRVLGIWGMRLGALLAAAVASLEPKRFSHLLLWQPVVEGRTMLTQFLRIRVAASMIAARSKETADGLRAEFAAGRTLEIGGYEVAPELAIAVDRLRLEACNLSAGTTVNWLEIRNTNAEPGRLPGNRQSILEKWRDRGAIVSVDNVTAEPFWTMEESIPTTQVIAATNNVLTTWLT